MQEQSAPPTTTSSKFRFRDHQEPESSEDSDSGSDLSSVKDDESELRSMTGKGISHLCMELLEIKADSDEDFHRNIFANYSAFVGILEEVNDVEKEMIQLKNQLLTQKRLVKDLIDGGYWKFLSEEGIESIIEESESNEQPQSGQLEAHINDVSEDLDILVSENRIDEAIAIIEMEEENISKVEVEDSVHSDALLLYNSMISEKKAMLTLQLTLVAENSRIAAPELQKALVGICRLGESHHATQLLIKYYHSRIGGGFHSLQISRSCNHVVYIRDLSKHVFSTISQAAKSFLMLYGETSPYASELLQWVREETRVFVNCFTKYVKSISEVSGGLATALEAVHFAMSYCSLLESQNLVLLPFLIKCVRPCMEEVLQMHIEHFKKVIGIFTATDTWVLGRYHVSGILNESYSSMVVGQQPNYCLLTNSGRKFVALLQAIGEDVSKLISIEMEGSILSGLMNLFLEYVTILERAITLKTNLHETSDSKVTHSKSVSQQVAILVNLSTLQQLFSSTVISTFKRISSVNSDTKKAHNRGVQQQDLDDCEFLIQEASSRLRAQFLQQFIENAVHLRSESKPSIVAATASGTDPNFIQDVMPSLAFQVFFSEMRKLDKFAEENVIGEDWLIDLECELIEALFVWISNKEFWQIDKERPIHEHANGFNQLVLDIHFLVEISRRGEYFSKNPLVLNNLMSSAFASVGLDPGRDVEDEGWAMEAASEAIERLLEVEKLECLSSAEDPPNDHSDHDREDDQEDERCSSANSEFSEDNMSIADLPEVLIQDGMVLFTLDGQEVKAPLDTNLTRMSMEDLESDRTTYDQFHFPHETSLSDLLLTAGANSASGCDEVLSNKSECHEVETKGSEIISVDDSARPRGPEVIKIV